MPKQKSKLIGFLLAVFTGPVSYLYVRKWKKTLLLLPLLLVPYVNIFVYLITLFAIVSDVKYYNRDKFNEARYGLVVCKCGAQNKSGSRFCVDCGFKLTKDCKKCSSYVLIDKNYCNYFGYGFEDKIKKSNARKKVVLIASASLIALILFYLSLLVVLEQHKSEKNFQNLTLENFEFPKKTNADRFRIHYELSKKKLEGENGLRTFINGTNVYTNDNEAKFDGKNIDWIVHLKKKGLINFNVSLYHYDKLLFSRQLSINATA